MPDAKQARRNKRTYQSRRERNIEAGMHPLNFWIHKPDRSDLIETKKLLREETGDEFTNAEIFSLGIAYILRELKKDRPTLNINQEKTVTVSRITYKTENL